MKKILTIAIIISLTLLSDYSFANEEIKDKYLTLEEVVKSAIKSYPKIFSQYDKIRAAESNLLAEKGFFDIIIKQNYSDKTRGYYDGKIYDTEIEKHLGNFGARVYGGYRKSYGKFAGYEEDLITNSGGEFRAGAKLSLLKDRDIDQNRLSVILGNLSIDQGKIELENIKMEIARDATRAYWSWVASGKILQIYKDLYQLSQKRQKQLEIKSQKGDVAEIIVVENRKNLLKRQASLAKISQEFEAASIYLSLFFRDENGTPIKPEQKYLPNLNLKLSPIPDKKEIGKQKELALTRRPEIRIIKIKFGEQSNELKYAKNLLQPKLDLDFGASKDEGKGPISRSEANNYANLNFSIPLQQREGRGKTAAAESKLSSLKYERTLIEDQINAEIDQIIAKKSTIYEIHSFLEEEAKLAEILQNAELEKFKHGASNFFLVNLREQDLAASKAALIEVFKEFQNTIADYDFAIFDSEKIIPHH